MGAMILIGSGLLLYVLRNVMPSWLGWLVLLGPWGFHNYHHDNTRISHPDYKSSSAYLSCLNIADRIYRDNFEEAIADPALWQLGGYKSARDYAAVSKSIVISSCNN